MEVQLTPEQSGNYQEAVHQVLNLIPQCEIQIVPYTVESREINAIRDIQI